jgi:hypothetical protein
LSLNRPDLDELRAPAKRGPGSFDQIVNIKSTNVTATSLRSDSWDFVTPTTSDPFDNAKVGSDYSMSEVIRWISSDPLVVTARPSKLRPNAEFYCIRLVTGVIEDRFSINPGRNPPPLLAGRTMTTPLGAEFSDPAGWTILNSDGTPSYIIPGSDFVSVDLCHLDFSLQLNDDRPIIPTLNGVSNPSRRASGSYLVSQTWDIRNRVYWLGLVKIFNLNQSEARYTKGLESHYSVDFGGYPLTGSVVPLGTVSDFGLVVNVNPHSHGTENGLTGPFTPGITGVTVFALTACGNLIEVFNKNRGSWEFPGGSIAEITAGPFPQRIIRHPYEAAIRELIEEVYSVGAAQETANKALSQKGIASFILTSKVKTLMAAVSGTSFYILVQTNLTSDRVELNNSEVRYRRGTSLYDLYTRASANRMNTRTIEHLSVLSSFF